MGSHTVLGPAELSRCQGLSHKGQRLLLFFYCYFHIFLYFFFFLDTGQIELEITWEKLSLPSA